MRSVTAFYNEEKRHVEYAVEKYSKMLFRISFSILCNREDAEDALQETFLKYMTKAPLFRDSDHEKAWLIKVVTNVSKNMSRYNTKRECADIEALKEIGVEDADVSSLNMVLKLDVKYRVVLDLFYIEGYKSREIAQMLDISPAAVRKRLQYARQELKKEFERTDSNDTKKQY